VFQVGDKVRWLTTPMGPGRGTIKTVRYFDNGDVFKYYIDIEVPRKGILITWGDILQYDDVFRRLRQRHNL